MFGRGWEVGKSLRDARGQMGDVGEPGHLGSFLGLGSFRYIRQGTGTVLINIPRVNRGGVTLGFRHRHWDRFEVVRWVGDQGRGLHFLRKPTGLAYRVRGNVVVGNSCVFEIRFAPTGRRVIGWTEGKLCGRGG